MQEPGYIYCCKKCDWKSQTEPPFVEKPCGCCWDHVCPECRGPIDMIPETGGKIESIHNSITETMSVLENMSTGGVGESGPTINELDKYVDETGNPWEGCQDYHTAQWAWRKLESILKDFENNPTIDEHSTVSYQSGPVSIVVNEC